MKSILVALISLAASTLSVAMPPCESSPASSGMDPLPGVAADDSAVSSSDSSNGIRRAVSSAADSGKITIVVSPEDASDAAITLVQRTTIRRIGSGRSSFPIPPDTLETRKAPMSALIPLGDYSLTVNKGGFKTFRESFALDDSLKSIPIKLLSLAYLKEKQEEWRTYKWISGAVACAGGALSYVFLNNIRTHTSQYNQAASPEIAEGNRNSIIANQHLYRVFGAVTVVALGSFVFSWFRELFTFSF